MKRSLGLVVCLVCVLGLSGCGLWDKYFGSSSQEPAVAAKPAPKPKPKPKPAPKAAENEPASQRQEAEKLLNEARACWQEGSVCARPREALGYLNQVVRMEPDNAEALRLRALAYRQLNYYEGAEKDATRAVTLETGAAGYASRSLVFSSLGNWLGAEKDARRALVMDDDLPLALIAIAEVEFHNNDAPGACAHLETACQRGDCGPWRRAVAAARCGASAP